MVTSIRFYLLGCEHGKVDQNRRIMLCSFVYGFWCLHQSAFLAPQSISMNLKFVMPVMRTLFNPAMSISYPKSKTWTSWHEKDGRSHRSELKLVHAGNHVRTMPHKFPSSRKPVQNFDNIRQQFRHSELKLEIPYSKHQPRSKHILLNTKSFNISLKQTLILWYVRINTIAHMVEIAKMSNKKPQLNIDHSRRTHVTT